MAHSGGAVAAVTQRNEVRCASFSHCSASLPDRSMTGVAVAGSSVAANELGTACTADER